MLQFFLWYLLITFIGWLTFPLAYRLLPALVHLLPARPRRDRADLHPRLLAGRVSGPGLGPKPDPEPEQPWEPNDNDEDSADGGDEGTEEKPFWMKRKTSLDEE